MDVLVAASPIDGTGPRHSILKGVTVTLTVDGPGSTLCRKAATLPDTLPLSRDELEVMVAEAGGRLLTDLPAILTMIVTSNRQHHHPQTRCRCHGMRWRCWWRRRAATY